VNEQHHRATRTLIRIAVLSFTATSVWAAEKNPDRDVFFGQTHSHTSWSVDAYLIGNHLTTPEDAYKYSMGLPIKHPAGFEVQITGGPLDFHGVTDHSEYAGVIAIANDPNSDLSKTEVGKKLQAKTPDEFNKVFQWIAGSLAKHQPIKELLNPEVAGSVWKKNIEIADQYYKPGRFTTFVAYEWTSAPNSRNMHRNVFFKDSKHVPTMPFTAIDSDRVEDLWSWMDAQRKLGNELLCISHNGNLSDGMMFPIELDSKGRPIDAAWAESRLRNEILTEIHQVKGTSETHPGLSPNDEFANYEIMNFLIGVPNSTSKLHGSYIRQGYENGLALQVARGYNPYKMGVVGASDSHNTVISYSQANNFGSHGFADGAPKERLAGKVESGMSVIQTSVAGLGGVWAEENTRESIFAAMQRKEVFATSGVRIKVRLFGGWKYQEKLLGEKDWVHKAYEHGVPMGGDLAHDPKAKAPSFVVWAVKDPNDANLDRVQIIKGWTRKGQIFEKVYDVAWSGDRKPDAATGKVPAVGSTVDIGKATYTNTIGANELKKVWTDPDFDPALHAFYYARVLQIPTPRWSTYDAAKLGVAPPKEVATTVQERVWTSPIWYTPKSEASKAANNGMTVAALKGQGAALLGTDELQSLLVGKTLKVRNTVTGENFDILYGDDGKRLITSVNGKQTTTDEVLTMMHGGQSGVSASYQIKDGRLVTTVAGEPFDIVVYKVGARYVAARSNEFGFANYEIENLK
jgi:hypothetical protein